ncbi:MAG TPA: hypothetical protein VMZ28_30465 [Kofleriaceae bacterium]|nr:hypothetical protein [Kofleriaceae bacterium]
MPKPLSEIVLEEGLATASAVSRAGEAADRAGIPLVVALVRECGIDEVALLAALRRHVRVSVGDPATVAADPDAVREISRDVCQRLTVVPLSVSSYDGRRRSLRLAMADPTDTVTVAEVEHVTGCRIEPVLMTVSAVEEMIEKTYRAFVTEVMRKREPQAVVRMTAKSGGGAPEGPATIPYHRLSDEADLELRFRALLQLLLSKQLITEDELEDEVRQLMRRHDQEP